MADKVTFLVDELEGVEGYKLVTGLVVPRPIGWIGSMSPDGIHNLAPYSFFNAVSGDPPTVIFSAGAGPGTRKDSADNVSASGEFTVNIVTDEVAEAMNATSAALPADTDEFANAGLTAVPGVIVRAPRVAEAKAQMECRVTHELHVGRGRRRQPALRGRGRRHPRQRGSARRNADRSGGAGGHRSPRRQRLQPDP